MLRICLQNLPIETLGLAKLSLPMAICANPCRIFNGGVGQELFAALVAAL